MSGERGDVVAVATGRDWLGRRLRRRSAGRRLGGWLDLEMGIGLAILAAIVLAAILAPLICRFGPSEVGLGETLLHPGEQGHLLGTDALGRDLFARILYGARTDLFLAFGGILAPLLVGAAIGAVAGYRGGLVDGFVAAVVAVVFAFPAIVLILTLIFVLGPSVLTILAVITIVDWVVYAQIVRSGTRAEKGMEYVVAARTGGLPGRRVLFGHILPNVIGQPIVYATSDVIIVMLDVVALGFLGVGVPPPTPEWGAIISEGRSYLATNPLLVLGPTAAIVLCALALAMIGDSLSRRLDSE